MLGFFTNSSNVFLRDSETGECIEPNATTVSDDSLLVRAIVFGVPASLIIVVTVVGNFLVLCFRAKVGKRQTTLLIWNLGLADFLVGIVVLPMGVTYVIARKWPFGYVMCKIWTACDVIFCTASIVTLCVISVDRYIGVTRPLRYKIIVTKTRITVAIVTIWAFSIGILVATERYQIPDCYDDSVCIVSNELEYVVHSVISAFFIPAAVTLVLYWKIYSVAKRRESGLRHGLMITLADNFLNPIADGMRVHLGKDSVNQQRKVIAMHKKVAKTLGVVVTAFLACWLPFFTTYLIHYHCDCVFHLLLDILSWLGYCNSMANPIIYAFTIDEFKDSLRTIFRTSRGRLKPHNSFPANPAPPKAGNELHPIGQTPSSGSNKSKLYGALAVSNNVSRQTSLSPTLSRASSSKKHDISRQHSTKSRSSNGSDDIDPLQFGTKDPVQVIVSEHGENVIWSGKLYSLLVDPKVTQI